MNEKKMRGDVCLWHQANFNIIDFFSRIISYFLYYFFFRLDAACSLYTFILAIQFSSRFSLTHMWRVMISRAMTI